MSTKQLRDHWIWSELASDSSSEKFFNDLARRISEPDIADEQVDLSDGVAESSQWVIQPNLEEFGVSVAGRVVLRADEMEKDDSLWDVTPEKLQPLLEAERMSVPPKQIEWDRLWEKWKSVHNPRTADWVKFCNLVLAHLFLPVVVSTATYEQVEQEEIDPKIKMDLLRGQRDKQLTVWRWRT